MKRKRKVCRSILLGKREISFSAVRAETGACGSRRRVHLAFMRHALPTLILTVGLACIYPVATPAAPDQPAASPAGSPSTPHSSADALKKELTAVIEGQLTAFRANDYPKAYTFAAAEIKEMFPVEDFEKMVRSNYAVIAKSTSTEYGVAFDTGEEAVVNVRVQNAEKKSVEYQYLLKKEDAGWKISGVSEVKAEGLSV